MLALFYIFIAVAFSIGIWQVNKLLRFTKKTITDENNQEVIAFVQSEENPLATEKNNDLTWEVFASFLDCILRINGVLFDLLKRYHVARICISRRRE